MSFFNRATGVARGGAFEDNHEEGQESPRAAPNVRIDWKKSVGEIIENADLEDQGESLEAIRFLDSNFTSELVNSIPELDLQRHNLLRIPPTIKRFSCLTSLDLSNNQIQFVDSPLLTRYCPNLKKIDISNNFVEDIREIQMLGLLKHLEDLNVSSEHRKRSKKKKRKQK